MSDVIAIILSFVTQYYIRFHSSFFFSNYKTDFIEQLYALIIFVLYWLILFFFAGLYKNWYERSPFDEIWGVVKATFIGTFIFVFVLFYSSASSPRMMFLIYIVLLTTYSVIGRYLVRFAQKRLRNRRIIKIPVLIVGTYDKGIAFFEKVKKAKNWGYWAKGLVLTSEKELNLVDENKFIFFYRDIEKIIEDLSPEVIIISTSRPNHEKLLEIVEIARQKNIRIKIEPDLYDLFTGRSKTHFLYGIPLIEISTQLLKPWQNITKRVFDIIFSSIVIVIGLPIWIIVALIIKLESEGNILFIQERVGRNNKPFKIFKFRSMKQNKGGDWTSNNDPRVTNFGRFIRKTHIDEMPQFVNVLIGDMSVVGPRPEQVKFVEEFSKEVPSYKRRHLVRPGITGWWQVKYTVYELNIDEIKNRLKDDFYYIENMSLKLDFEIIIRTIWVMIQGHGQT